MLDTRKNTRALMVLANFDGMKGEEALAVIDIVKEALFEDTVFDLSAHLMNIATRDFAKGESTIHIGEVS